jgi:hypothetical protein
MHFIPGFRDISGSNLPGPPDQQGKPVDFLIFTKILCYNVFQYPSDLRVYARDSFRSPANKLSPRICHPFKEQIEGNGKEIVRWKSVI